MMKSRPVWLLVCLLLVLSLLSVPAAAEETLRAIPATQSLVIDGTTRHGAEIYIINEETYYRLRDMAMLLAGTRAEFGVTYDAETNSIEVTRGGEYLPVGDELSRSADHAYDCLPSGQTLRIDGTETRLTAYVLGGTNFFRLRDLGPALGFGVDYDPARNAVLIETNSALTRIRLGSSDYFLTLPADYAPRETGGYAGKSGVSLDVYELTGVSDLRRTAEAEATGAGVSEVTVSGCALLSCAAGSKQVYFLDAGGNTCEKLVFDLNGGEPGAALDVLRTLEKPLRVRLGSGPMSLYLPETFAQDADGAFADAAAKRYIYINYTDDSGDFDAYVSALGKTWGGGSAQNLSLITKYYVIDPVPAPQRLHGLRCCMPCAIRLGEGKAATVTFWADNNNFGWALKILRSLSAA